ncbi:Riboflavin synthase [Candidatus Xiphinematobacter sp. Idaho Grape]|uniref:riboflavin synthase n=1 Tax=Candidatus Xiphinematobacter sp. Idaho Grape TaxID=1704307 RepID=UPI0007064AD5|nr:riboflavin synthase [Candidatus Xiphinematobacter sp. Idaho Grape]ALJ56406.1 Riboflavin synthase [Candidatus Xiphinematobacter sp. Idaho Grape]
MFTGLIEEVGRVIGLEKQAEASLLSAYAPKTAASCPIGSSVAVNGCCLTAVAISENQIEFHLLQETLFRTNLGDLQVGDHINCELPLLANGRLGGHLVQGHIDCTARVLSSRYLGQDFWAEIEIPLAAAHYLIFKGSIAVNGVSLTVAKLKERSFAVCITPYTHKCTNLGSLRAGMHINLEFDMVAKYVERMRATRIY